MLHASAALSVPIPPLPDTPDDDGLDPLLRLAGEPRTTRTLVIAAQSLDLICGLLRRGCPTATAIRPGSKPDAHDYPLVVVAPACGFPPEGLVRQIRDALAPGGRLIARVPAGAMARSFIRRLHLNGFAITRTVHLPHLTLLCADLRSAT
jgi:hypothetical protein